MSRRTDRVYSPTIRGDRSEQESRRSERAERTERTEAVPRTPVERLLQQSAPRTSVPELPSTSTTHRASRTPIQEDPSAAAQESKTNRTNEYFVPREGIDREVVTADICRYLGNDALVRPGNYTNPQTRQPQEGYYITAYRNLTSEMITDLKADSERWQAERRLVSESSRGNARNAQYSSSRTHEYRQYYGPTTPAIPSGTLVAPSASDDHQDEYDTPNYHYGSDQASLHYGSTQAYPLSERNPDSSARAGYYTGSTPAYSAQPDSRTTYYPGQAQAAPNQAGYAQPADALSAYYSNQVAGSSAQAAYASQQADSRGAYYDQPAGGASQTGYPSQQPTDLYYDRPYGDSTPSDSYGVQYQQDPNIYPAAPITPSNTTSTSSGPVRRDPHRDDRHRERDRHSRR